MGLGTRTARANALCPRCPHAQELVDAGWPHNTTVVLDLPCPFLSIM